MSKKINLKFLHQVLTKMVVGDSYVQPPTFHNKILDLFTNQDRLQLIAAPVGFAKSSTLKSFAIMEILSGTKFILYVSSSYTKVRNQFTGFKKILSDPIIKKMFNYEININNETQITIKIDGENRSIVGVASGADILGINFENARPEKILIDDLEELDQARSVYRTELLIEWLHGTLVSRLPSLIEGKVRMIGTNLTRNSIINRIFNNEIIGWKHYKFPALDENNLSIWEEKHPTAALLNEQRLNPHFFASNYLNEPLDLADGLINIEDILFHRFVPKINNNEIFIHADITHTGKQTSDYFCVGGIGKGEDNIYYLIDYHLDKLNPEDQAKFVIYFYKKMQSLGYSVKRITFDAVGNDGFGYFARHLAKEQNISLPLEPKKYPKDKVSHLTPHIPHFKAGRMSFPVNHEQWNIAKEQLLYFPSTTHDDFVDMLSGVLDNFIEKTSVGFKKQLVKEIKTIS